VRPWVGVGVSGLLLAHQAWAILAHTNWSRIDLAAVGCGRASAPAKRAHPWRIMRGAFAVRFACVPLRSLHARFRLGCARTQIPPRRLWRVGSVRLACLYERRLKSLERLSRFLRTVLGRGREWGSQVRAIGRHMHVDMNGAVIASNAYPDYWGPSVCSSRTVQSTANAGAQLERCHFSEAVPAMRTMRAGISASCMSISLQSREARSPSQQPCTAAIINLWDRKQPVRGPGGGQRRQAKRFGA